jgi:hypothetical protein
MHIGYWWESQKERDHWENQGVDGWTILKWILDRIILTKFSSFHLQCDLRH